MHLFRLAWIVVVLLSAAAAPAADDPPHVLLLVSDDQRPDTLGCLGNRLIQTPHLDQLARTGTMIVGASCAHPVCVPSRAELLSGLTSFRNGYFADRGLSMNVTTWPEVMRRAGYRTAYVGKWHTRGRPSQRGFEEVEGLYASGPAPREPQLDRHGRPVTGYVGWQFQTDEGRRMPEKGIGLTPDISREFADAAIRVLQREDDRPLFLQVNFTAPHDPLFLPTGYAGRYLPAQIPVPGNFLPQHPFDHGNLRGRDELLWPFPRTSADVQDELAVYYALITHLDEQIGRILAALDETGRAERTLVIFTSDHGLAIGSHGLRGKQNMYEHTIRVPLIVKGPSIPAGERREADCYLRDLFPTVCELAGVPVPGGLDGRSLVGLLRGEVQRVHPFLIGYYEQAQRLICRDGWKLIEYPQASRVQLFDLAQDPLELHDRSTDPALAERLASLRETLHRWEKENSENSARPNLGASCGD